MVSLKGIPKRSRFDCLTKSGIGTAYPVLYAVTWAVPFVAAAMDAGGELIAGARIPARDVIDALDALEAPEARQPVAAAPSGG